MELDQSFAGSARSAMLELSPSQHSIELNQTASFGVELQDEAFDPKDKEQCDKLEQWCIFNFIPIIKKSN